MGFILKVRFRGLCGFAPRRDGHKLWVFMPDEQDADTDGERPGLEEHFARMKFAAHFKTGATSFPAGVDALWPLSKVDIQIKDANGAPLPEDLNIAGFGPDIDLRPITLPPLPDPSFEWIGSLELACTKRGHPPGAGSIKAGYVGTLPLTPADLIGPLAARIQITSGTLIVERHVVDVVDSNALFVISRFRPRKSEEKLTDHKQFLASRVSIDIPINTNSVIFEARDLSTGTFSATIELEPLGGIVIVDFINEEGIQYLKDKTSSVKIKGTRKRDRIFESFYKLSQTPPPRGDRPLPVADLLVEPPGVPALSSPPCSPARYNTTP